jgi:uncharacterized cupin superfamily protein
MRSAVNTRTSSIGTGEAVVGNHFANRVIHRKETATPMNNLDRNTLKTQQVEKSIATVEVNKSASDWSVWTCAGSKFTLNYDRTVSFVVCEGSADLAFKTGERLSVRPQDFVTIKAGSIVSWRVTSAIKNLYVYHDTFANADQRPRHEAVEMLG